MSHFVFQTRDELGSTYKDLKQIVEVRGYLERSELGSTYKDLKQEIILIGKYFENYYKICYMVNYNMPTNH